MDTIYKFVDIQKKIETVLKLDKYVTVFYLLRSHCELQLGTPQRSEQPLPFQSPEGLKFQSLRRTL